MATKSQEILLKGNTTNASAVPSSLKVREIAINALDRSLFTNDGNSIVKLYTGTTKWFDVNGNANNALKLGGILASEYINKEAFNSHINNSTIHITAAERTKWNNKWDYNEETIKGVKVNAAVNADKLTSDAGTSAIPIYFKNGKPTQCIPSDLFSSFDNAYSSTGEHSLGITIAGHTRMVVVAYSTLSEKANKLATPRTLWGRPFNGSANVDGDLKDVGNITASGKATIQGDIISGGEVAAIVGEGTPAGVTDYSALTGKPAINGVTLLSGNNTLVSLGIQPAGDYVTNSGVTTLLADYAKKTFVSNNYVGKSAFNSHTADTDIHITEAERIAWNAKWDYNENKIKAVKVNSASSADSVAWSGISGKPSTFAPSAHTHTASEVSGLPTSLKNPYALTFGSKTYDGSAAKTITASDLGALTAHQSIYAFTLQVNGTSQGVYNPASAAKTINIAVPTKTSQITNDSGFITSAAIPTALKNPYAVEIKANGVSLGTYDGSKAATFNLSAANVGAANKVHSHTASEVSGLPTKLSAFTNDVGYITGITKSMVEGVLTGNITSHTHSQYLTSALRPAKLFTSENTFPPGYFIITINNNNSKWILSFDVKIVVPDGSYTIRFSEDNSTKSESWYRPSASMIDGEDSVKVKFGYRQTNKWVAILATYPYAGVSITNVANGYAQIDTYALDELFTINFFTDWGALEGDDSGLELLGTVQETITIYPPSKEGHTHTFASLTSKPTTINGYGITDALTTSNYNSYVPTRTGTGASGTWGINISGNAATATNADTLDGYHETGFYRAARQYISSGDMATLEAGSYYNGDALGDINPLPHTYSSLSVLGKSWYSQQLCVTYNATRAWLRGVTNSSTTTVSDWHELAFTDSNVASATKLQTPRTLWGRPFDGSNDVYGSITIRDNVGLYQYTPDGTTPLFYIGHDNNNSYVHIYNFKGGNYIRLNDDGNIYFPKGNILIGTTTDNGSKMMIQSSVSSSARPTLGNLKGNIVTIGTSGYYGLHLWNEGSGDGFIQVGRSDGNATAYNLVLQPLGGNILIGTTTDNGYKLQVNGSERVYGDLIVDGEVSALVA